VRGDQGRALALELRLHYVEASAKSGLHVEQAYFDVARLIKKFHENDRKLETVKQKKRKKSCTIM